MDTYQFGMPYCSAQIKASRHRDGHQKPSCGFPMLPLSNLGIEEQYLVADERAAISKWASG
jgi:hypothetical protein